MSYKGGKILKLTFQRSFFSPGRQEDKTGFFFFPPLPGFEIAYTINLSSPGGKSSLLSSHLQQLCKDMEANLRVFHD